jgi:hypothetical protein
MTLRARDDAKPAEDKRSREPVPRRARRRFGSTISRSTDGLAFCIKPRGRQRARLSFNVDATRHREKRSAL